MGAKLIAQGSQEAKATSRMIMPQSDVLQLEQVILCYIEQSLIEKLGFRDNYCTKLANAATSVCPEQHDLKATLSF